MKINYKPILLVAAILLLAVSLFLLNKKMNKQEFQKYQTNFENIDLLLNENIDRKPKKAEDDSSKIIKILNVKYKEIVNIERAVGFQKVYKNESNTLVISRLKDDGKLYEKQMLELKKGNTNLIMDDFDNPIYINELGQEFTQKGVEKDIIFYESLNKNESRLSYYFTVDEEGNIVQQGDRMNELFFKVENDMIYVQFDFEVKNESIENMIDSILGY